MRIPSLVALVATFVPALAAAEPVDDPSEIARQEGTHLGVGVESTLGGVTGVAVRAGIGPMLGLEGVLSIEKSGDEYIPGGFTGSSTTVAIAGRAIVPLRRFENGVIAVVGGMDIGVRAPETGANGVHLAFEGGLRAEYFLATHLSMSLEVGAVIDLPPDDQARVLSPAVASGRPMPGATTTSFDNTVLAGGAGLTFWFR